MHEKPLLPVVIDPAKMARIAELPRLLRNQDYDKILEHPPSHSFDKLAEKVASAYAKVCAL